jgi:hypothetical protein
MLAGGEIAGGAVGEATEAGPGVGEAAVSVGGETVVAAVASTAVGGRVSAVGVAGLNGVAAGEVATTARVAAGAPVTEGVEAAGPEQAAMKMTSSESDHLCMFVP